MKNSSRPKFRKKAKPDPASLKERRRFMRIFRPFWPKNASTSTKPGIRGDKRAQRAWRSPKASCARARRNAPSLETGHPARFFQKERPSVGFPSILAEECLNLSEAGNSQRQTHTEDSDALRNLQARKCAEFGNRPVGNGLCFFRAADAPILGANPPAFKRSGKPVSKSLFEISAGRGWIAFHPRRFWQEALRLEKKPLPKSALRLNPQPDMRRKPAIRPLTRWSPRCGLATRGAGSRGRRPA